ncbi:hypothetical protein Rsub_01057 [Raphidocelis subcapitata]|uniref:At4g15545-like C-terminal domain-containing protein n=1 Tax=Raphidocelis subcapitata TaxID=307507 RepID=A0A2V0NU36_9CHLO|nr:hypothetical protein Rsub_01057 [Raphidocelis subcapitata]|eukprot:GBF88345.1 hypothetical protein Rsub_01057 [Raphidocelis subcapitata]
MQLDSLPRELAAPLPRDLAAALPAAPEQQLMCGAAVVAQAVTAVTRRVAALEAECARLREDLSDSRRRGAGLEAEAAALRQRQARDAEADQQQLADDKAALVATIAHLNAELARAAQLRRKLLRDLQEGDGGGGGGGGGVAAAGRGAPGVGDAATERLVRDVLGACHSPVSPDAAGAGPSGGAGYGAAAAHSGGAGHRSCHSRALASDASGAVSGGSPPLRRGGGSPGRAAAQSSGSPGFGGRGGDSEGSTDHALVYEPRGTSPGRHARWAPSPPRHRAPSPPVGAAQQPPVDALPRTPPRAAAGGAGAAPGAGALPAPYGSPSLDGKEFFRRARSRLSLGTFSEFLSTIKDLNCGRATRAQTLRRARQLFGGAGSSNHDLYELFERLLSRHGVAP